MRNRFDKQLVQLNDYMLEMGSLIEQSIEMCVKALVSQDESKSCSRTTWLGMVSLVSPLCIPLMVSIPK